MSTVFAIKTHKINIVTTDKHDYFQITKSIAKFPKSLYAIGNIPENRIPTVAIIGTRHPTTYGQEVTYRFAYDLAKRGVVIVSGLALGTDAIAHKAALDAGGTTIAVLPASPDNVAPRTNAMLAERIITQNGALISEFGPGSSIYRGSFVARNRIVAAMSDATLIVEAAHKSGTLHTAGFALDYNRHVFAVPGNITSPMSAGTNHLIKSGAQPVTELDDILRELDIDSQSKQQRLPLAENAEESVILQLIHRGVRDGDLLQQQSGLPPAQFNQTLTMLEITQKIRPLGGNKWTLR